MNAPATGWSCDRHEPVLDDVALELLPADDAAPVCLVVRGALSAIEGAPASLETVGLECVVSLALTRAQAAQLGRALLAQAGDA